MAMAGRLPGDDGRGVRIPKEDEEWRKEGEHDAETTSEGLGSAKQTGPPNTYLGHSNVSTQKVVQVHTATGGDADGVHSDFDAEAAS